MRPASGTAGHRDVRLLGPADVRELAGRLDVRPSKRLGQNFVIDPGTLRRIVALAGVRTPEALARPLLQLVESR